MFSFSSPQASAAPKSGMNAWAGLSLLLMVLVFIASGISGFRNINVLRDDSQKIQSTHTVILALEELYSTLQRAESVQRGFLLTGEERYLGPYESAVAEIEPRLERMAGLVSSSEAQQARLRSLRQQVDARLADMERSISERRSEGLTAAAEVVAVNGSVEEMSSIRAQLDMMGREEVRQRQLRIAEMADAHRTAWLSAVLSCLLGIALTLIIAFMIRRASIAREREQWLQTGQANLSSAMLGEQSLRELGENILGFLTKYLGAQGGVIFAQESGQFHRIAADGVPADAGIIERFSPKEGLLGRVAADREALILHDIPDGYITIGSAFGRDKPRHLAISPAVAEDVVQGVLELGFLQPVDDLTLAFLKHASAPVAIALRSARLRAEMQNLLEETQRQAEELQAQSEELRVSNEELEEQGRALKESQVRLEHQQVELEQTNTQLEEQAHQLEAQRDDLARANAAVELKARELEQASRYKSDFLANMSHELRTPLNSLLILSKLLGDNPDGNLTEDQVKYAHTIQSSGNDLLTLINHVLDLSKIEAGHVQMQPETVSIERLTADLRQTFEPIAGERRLQFDVTIDENCPKEIETDRQRVEQILKNLLSNAFKFTHAGSVKLSIECTAAGRIALAVSDTGIGIPEDKQREIFEAFHQADGTVSRKYGGTGLGLSISRELARLLGGTITLTSKEGEGSRFTLTIPVSYDPALVEARDDPKHTRAQVEPQVTTPTPPKPAPIRRIEDDRDHLRSTGQILLVVEDDNAFAGIVRDLSHEMGFQCLVAATAAEALELARKHNPSAVVLDVGLPDESGLTVLDRLKGDIRTRHIPVHVVSASDHSHTALSLGAIGYLVKPVKREELAGVLHALSEKLEGSMRRVLIVEDDPVQRQAVAQLLTSGEVETVGAGTAAECLQRLKEQTFDCMVLDLSLPDASGISLLETLSEDENHSFPPVIVYTGHELSPEDEQHLRRYSDSIIIKGARSPERLLDEVSLFLHQVVAELPPEQQKMIQKARNRDAILEGRRILVVEDDVRNIYSLTNILEPRGAIVEIARNGREAIEALENATQDKGSTIDLVLMDVMMPVMDGLTATREIRKDGRWTKLPIITLTAKAMPDDQQRCIDAGANDYMAKPLDVDKLLSLVRVWMPR